MIQTPKEALAMYEGIMSHEAEEAKSAFGLTDTLHHMALEELAALRADAERWRKLTAYAFMVPAGSTIAAAPYGGNREDVTKHLNEWADGLVVPEKRKY